MTDAELLLMSTDKATHNGFKFDVHGSFIKIEDRIYIDAIYQTIIFSHDFARAFFGVDYTKDYYDTTQETGWACHLQQMVLEPEPLQYLARFLEEESTV